MNFRTKNLSSAVRLALSLGVIAAGASGAAFAQDTSSTAQANPAPQKSTQTLDTITVTGSHIRRVDVETSDPVITIGREAIEASGKQTLGDLVQQLPAMTGGNVNPQVNNAGGTGGSSLNLRGLGSNRTLVLVDGHRVLNSDPNSIPASMIERIDVLTSGASAVYGSDAIGGVVNFITRKNFQGATFTANYGQSDHNDGNQSGYSFTFGQTGDKGSIIGGIEYNKQDAISSSARKFSKNAVSRYGTTSSPISTIIGGSSSSPYGHFQIPQGVTGGTTPSGGCGAGAYIARNPTTTGATPSDYHCYTGADRYNYATVNLILTPQERTNAFVMGTYNLSDNVSAYLNVYHDKTRSSFQLAPGVYTTAGGVDISADNYFNPYKGLAPDAQYAAGHNTYGARLSALGNRTATSGITNDQVSTGLKGSFPVFEQDWQWEAGMDYGHQSVVTTTLGLPDQSKLYTGPSFLDPTTGVVTRGTPDAPLAGDASFNPFDLDSPASVAALQAAGAPAVSNAYSQEKIYHVDLNGGVFDLPAGAVQLAAGASYREEYTHSIVASGLQIDPDTGTCILGSQCSSGLQGGYNVKEAYAEAFIPVLKDLPLIHSLNVTIGDRYSKFSTFGTTNNLKFAVEYRPIDDLLLRGTVAEVFRAPNLSELYGPPISDAPSITSDPCTGYTGGGNPACVNVPTNGTFVNQNVQQNLQLTTISSGANYAGFPLKPEQGKTFDFGAVYNPSWLPGASASVDVWHVYLNDIITSVGAQSVLNLCSAGQTVYCQFIHRYADGPNQGQLTSQFIEPTGNLGSMQTGGIDFSLNYKLPEFSIGRFTAGINGTYLKYYNLDTAPGTDANIEYTNAGHYLPYNSAAGAACPDSNSGCLLPRWRAQTFLNWQLGNWDASWRMRYIGRFRMGSPNPTQDSHPFGTGNPSLDGLYQDYGATVYNDISFGYNIKPLNTRFDVGVNNLFDKQPPFLYANNTLNANTDPADFDLIGRYFWARVTVNF